MQRQAVILSLGGVLMVVAGWAFGGERGAIATAAGIAFGWLARHVRRRAVRPAVVQPPVPPPLDDTAMRLQTLEAKTSSLRHDLRGILSPALLTAERLVGYEDPVVRRAGEIMVKTVERASARLAETKK